LFGADYGQRLMRWARANYSKIWWDKRNDPPLEPGSKFGTAIFHRNAE